MGKCEVGEAWACLYGLTLHRIIDLNADQVPLGRDAPPALPIQSCPPPKVKHMRAAFERPVVFTLMNSFSTSEDTRAFLAQGHADLLQVREGLGCGKRAPHFSC